MTTGGAAKARFVVMDSGPPPALAGVGRNDSYLSRPYRLCSVLTASSV